jgi:hypothetical protein
MVQGGSFYYDCTPLIPKQWRYHFEAAALVGMVSLEDSQGWGTQKGCLY